MKVFSIALLCFCLPDVACGDDTVPYPVRVQSEIEFASPDGVQLLLDLHMPEGFDNPPLVMFIHGGGWKGGTRKNCRLAWVAKHGYAVASIEYRLSQKGIFPAQIHDCKGALRWLRANAKKYGYRADKVVVAGTSAGGHLAALMGTSGDVATLEGETSGYLEQSSRVQGIIDYYGPSDFVLRSKSHPKKTEDPTGSVFKLFGGKASEKLDLARLASPVTHISDDDPPLIILHGDQDKTVFPEQSVVFLKVYQTAGLQAELLMVQGAGHGWKPTNQDERTLVLKFLASILK